MESINRRLAKIKVVPVIALKDADKAAKLAQVLVENGLPCAEVTFRTSAVHPVQFMPTGGINPANVKDYPAMTSVIACGGTWMVPGDLIANEQWEDLAVLVREVADIAA